MPEDWPAARFVHKSCEIDVEKVRNKTNNLIKLLTFLSAAYF